MLLLSGLILTQAHPAYAVLGERVQSGAANQLRFKGQHRMSVSQGVQVHEIAMSDGAAVREFVSSNGTVFAVAWRTRVKPDLGALLGTHFAGYAAAASEAASAQPGIKRGFAFDQGDLVVRESAHLNAFSGLAYLRSQVPEGVDTNALR